VGPVFVVTAYRQFICGEAFDEYYRQVDKKWILFVAFIPAL
jgi:hypothetical protein